MSVSRGDDLERRTVSHLRSIGYHAERVSRRALYGTKDIFGVVDILAVGPSEIMLAQVTTKTNASSHRRKIRDAQLGVPVRLFLWWKDKNRWVFVSEEVA